MNFHVPEMSCGHCTAAITKEIKALDRSAVISTDLETRTIEVTSVETAGAVIAAVKAAGYDATPV